MMNRKLAVSSAALTLGAWKFFSLEHPENYEAPNAFRFQTVFLHALDRYAKCSEYLGLTKSVEILRKGIEFVPPGPVNLGIKKLDREINGVKARIYTPVALKDIKNAPIIIYYHGGGYIMGSLNQYDEYNTELSFKSNAVVISVDYNLAPEHPFPKPTDDCYALTKYVLESKNEFGNTNKVILAGDSAGGNAVAVITQRLKAEKIKQPVMQVLIYPWTQLFTYGTASGDHLSKHNPDGVFAKFVCSYMGVTDSAEFNATREMFDSHRQIELLDDLKEREKIKSYCDSNLIPAEYKKDAFYTNYNVDETFVKNQVRSGLLKDDKLKELFKKLTSPEVSPGFAEPKKLIGLPKAYFILSGFDVLRDDGLLYAERLRKAGNDVQVKYYENSFHGVSQVISKTYGVQVARDMLEDLVKEIKKFS